MQEIVLGVLKALLGVAGPVSRYAWRKTAHKKLDELERDLSVPDSLAQKRAQTFVKALTERGLNQRQRIDLAAFCSSDEAAFCFRLIAINVLAGNPLRDDAQSALNLQVTAMIKLFMRDSKYGPADVAGPLLTDEAVEATHRIFQKILSRDSELARSIREIAIQQSRLPDMLKQSQMEGRAEGLLVLADALPSVIQGDIDRYVELIAEDNAALAVAAVGRTVEVPIAECLIDSRCRSSEGRLFIADRAGGASLLPTILADHSHVVLLGDPGGGKSTAVRAAIYEYAKDNARSKPVVPFLVTLRRYARALDANHALGLVPFIHDSFEADHDHAMTKETLRYLLHTGRAVVFFDGLDEILDLDLRRQVADKIERFARRFAGAAMVVTSRAIGYDQVPIRSGFLHLDLDPFDELQVEQYASNVFSWLREDPEESHEAFLERFIADSAAIGDIRSNPLMLGILCFLFASGRSLPHNRLELYRRCADLLFDAWDDGRGLKTHLQDTSAAEQGLRELALEIFDSGEEEMSEGQIKETLAKFYRSSDESMPAFRGTSFANEAFDAWTGRRWILIFAGEHLGEQYFRFAHRTFLEFFAAEQIAYECETSTEAWARISHHVEQGTATPLCQLVLQIMSSKTKGAGAKFLSHALDHEGIEPQTVSRFNILAFASASISGLRTDEATRDRLLQRCLNTLAQIAPWVSQSQMRDRTEPPFVGYDAVLQHRATWPAEKQESSIADDYDIDGASGLLKGFAGFGPKERQRLLAVAKAYILAQLEAEPGDRWLRLTLLLLLVSRFEGWSAVSLEWRTDLEKFGREVWSEVANRRYARVHDSPDENDYWLNLSLLRDQAISDPKALRVLGVPGLFVGDWPYPALDYMRGTVAHTLSMAALGVRAIETPSKWTEQEVDRMLDEVLLMITDVDGQHSMSTNEAQHAPDWNIQSRESAVKELTVARMEVGLYLLVALRQYGDARFCQHVLDTIPNDALARDARQFLSSHSVAEGAWFALLDSRRASKSLEGDI